MAKTVGEACLGEEDQEFSFGCEMPVRFLSGNVMLVFGYLPKVYVFRAMWLDDVFWRIE